MFSFDLGSNTAICVENTRFYYSTRRVDTLWRFVTTVARLRTTQGYDRVYNRGVARDIRRSNRHWVIILLFYMLLLDTIDLHSQLSREPPHVTAVDKNNSHYRIVEHRDSIIFGLICNLWRWGRVRGRRRRLVEPMWNIYWERCVTRMTQANVR